MPSLFSIDRAWDEVERSVVVDQLAALGSVGLGEQNVARNMVELWIAVIGIAIGISQLESFDKFVNVLG
jgi:hypothetical protein